MSEEVLPANFKVAERREDEFGVLYVSDRGTTFRIHNGPEPIREPLRKKYMTMSGNPATSNTKEEKRK